MMVKTWMFWLPLQPRRELHVGRPRKPITVTPEDLAELQRIVDMPQIIIARTLLALAGGESVGGIARQVGCDPATVWRVSERYRRQGLDGAFGRQRSEFGDVDLD